jgi:hypothetical protein
LTELNFPLFWGLSIMLYESTLVSNQTPFDRFADGDPNALGESALRGFAVFSGKGLCFACHPWPLMTGAVTPLLLRRDAGVLVEGVIEGMIMGDTLGAFYDAASTTSA